MNISATGCEGLGLPCSELPGGSILKLRLLDRQWKKIQNHRQCLLRLRLLVRRNAQLTLQTAEKGIRDQANAVC